MSSGGKWSWVGILQDLDQSIVSTTVETLWKRNVAVEATQDVDVGIFNNTERGDESVLGTFYHF